MTASEEIDRLLRVESALTVNRPQPADRAAPSVVNSELGDPGGDRLFERNDSRVARGYRT